MEFKINLNLIRSLSAPAAAGSHPDWQEQKIPTKSDLDQRPRGFNAGRLNCDVPSSVAAAALSRDQISPDQICLLEDGEQVLRGTSWDHFPAELRDVDKTIRLVLTKRSVQREILGGKCEFGESFTEETLPKGFIFSDKLKT